MESLSDAALLAWEAALTVRGAFGPLQGSALERSARADLRAFSRAHNPRLARLASDAARASSIANPIPRADGRKADVVSIA